MTTATKKILLGALVVPAIALAAACTSGSNNNAASGKTADSGGSSGRSAPLAVPSPAEAGAAVKEATDGNNLDAMRGDYATTTKSLADNVPNLAPQGQQGTVEHSTPDQINPAQTQAIISKGQISLHSKDIDKTRFELQMVLDNLNGTIADEQSNADKQGRTILQRLVLRVPSAKFSKAMDGISRLDGVKLVSRSRSSEDVTTQVIDNKTRVRTQRASLARIQALLSQATSLNQIISIESQLSRRQAELDSLEAQQKYLANQTSLSTIDVYLSVPDKKHAAPKKHGHDFFSGFRSGWNHLGSSTNALLTAIGAALPFAVLLALIGFPAWAAWRRRAVRTAPAASAEA